MAPMQLLCGTFEFMITGPDAFGFFDVQSAFPGKPVHADRNILLQCPEKELIVVYMKGSFRKSGDQRRIVGGVDSCHLQDAAGLINIAAAQLISSSHRLFSHVFKLW